MQIVVHNSKFWDARFSYHPGVIAAVKRIGGARFVAADKGGPLWRLPATLETFERLAEEFDLREIEIDKAIIKWATREIKQATLLRNLSNATSAKLTTLPDLNPALHEFVSSRPYQLADIMFMAESPNPLNFNQPGTGKTVETIGAVYEAGLDQGPVLVIAPLGALTPTWGDSLATWATGVPVATSSAAGGHTGTSMLSALRLAAEGEPVWVLMNPEQVKQRKDGTCPYPAICKIEWNCIVIDEFHRMGLSNNKTLFYQSIKKLKARKKILLSGTPIGGKPIKLWGALNFLYPDRFTSKWAFAENWLSIHDNGYGKDIGDVKKHRREEFNLMMAQYSVRRLKVDIMQWLPPKQYVYLWPEMTKKQAAQYQQWEANTEIEIEEEQLDALSILAVYTRLRQFANAVQTIEYLPDETFRLKPTDESCKLPVLWEILDDRAVLDPDGTEKIVVFSQFTQFVNVVATWLRARGVEVGVITGETKVADRNALVRRFQTDPSLRVMLMNTQAGGVSITLDKADTVVFLDETWNPDDQEQAEDRVHRGTKTSQVTVYKIFAKDTIDERIYKGNLSKDRINQRILNRDKHKT